MDRMHHGIDRRRRSAIGSFAVRGIGPMLLAFALVQPCRAESTVQSAPAGGGTLTASAHLNFRITVLPSFGLSTIGTGVRIQGNSGMLTLQRSQNDAWDGRAPAGSIQLRPRHQVIDTSMHVSSFGGSNLITIASP